MNTRRQGRRSDDERSGTAAALAPLAFELSPPGAVQVALQTRQPVEEERAVEVVDLVLKRHREELLRLDGDLALVRSPRAHEHTPGALHRCRQLGYRQAAFLPHDLAFALRDHRVDEL